MENQSEANPNRGVYLLWLYLPKKAALSIGKLGTFQFDAGVYAYCGSAQRNLRQRLARHGRLDKKLHWHIDYFRAHSLYLGEVVFYDWPKEGECRLVRELLRIPGTRHGAPRFGAGDCRCGSHFLYLPLLTPKNKV